MKRKSIIPVIISTMLLTTMTILASQTYTIYIDGNKLDGKVIVQDGTTYVPLRGVSEALGCNVDVQSGMIAITSSGSNVAPVVDTPQVTPTTESKPSEVVVDKNYPMKEGYSTAPLTQYEMKKVFDKMVEKSSTSGNAFYGKTVTATNFRFENDDIMYVDYSVDEYSQCKYRTEKYTVVQPANARAYLDGKLINGYWGCETRTIKEDVVKKEIKPSQGKFVQDENGMWVRNPDY